MPQDKLTAVRIKQENGEYGPQIPVAAKAENVEYNEEYSVKEVLGDINVNKGPLQEQIENIDTSTIQAALEARLDEWEEQAQIPVTSVAVDSYLTNQGQAADAKQAGKVVTINDETDGNATKLHLNTSDDIVNIALMDDVNTRINRPIKNGQYDNGEQGQLLRTNGDGSTEWVNEGLPTDEQVQEVVDEWMDQHSGQYVVPDESLTYEKLVKGTLGYVTPEMYGAVGDGITDDTEAFTEMLQLNKFVVLQPKTYYVKNLYVLSNTIIYGNNAELVFDNSASYSLRINDAENVSIYDLNISLTTKNLTSQSGIRVDSSNNIHINNIRVSGFGGDGIYIDKSHGIWVVDSIFENNLINIFAYESYDVHIKDCISIGGDFKYTVQYKSCWESVIDGLTIYDGNEISLYISKELITDNPDAKTPYNIRVSNVKIIDSGKNIVASSGTYVALCIQDGYNYQVSNVIISNAYYSGVRLTADYSTFDNIIVDGYAKNGSINSTGFISVSGKHNTINNVSMSNGTGTGLSSALTHSVYANITMCDVGAVSGKNGIEISDNHTNYSNIHFEEKTATFHKLYFTSDSDYVYLVGITNYRDSSLSNADIIRGTIPNNCYVQTLSKSRASLRGIYVTGKFIINDNTITVYSFSAPLPSGGSWVSGDTIYPANPVSAGYEKYIYNGSSWIGINQIQ